MSQQYRYIYCTYVRNKINGMIGIKKFMFFVFFLAVAIGVSAQNQNREIKVATFNVDGLPPTLSAVGLTININPEGPQEKYTKVIAQKLMEKSWDVVGLNEDFNYHDVLTSNLSGYQVMTHGGRFEASALIALGILARTYRFKTDGLGLLVKQPMRAYNEYIKAWNDCYGYLDHDNDSLTLKGFRHYEVDVDDQVTLDFIVLHADAHGAEQDRQARVKQMAQLMDYVESSIKCNHPLIIMGDFNTRYDLQDLKGMVLDRLNNNKSIDARDAWQEYLRSKEHGNIPEMLDKIIYVNRQKSDFKLILKEFGNGYDFLRDDGTALSDHYPAYATFEIEDKNATGISEIEAPRMEMRKRIVNGRLVIEKDGRRYGITGTRQ